MKKNPLLLVLVPILFLSALLCIPVIVKAQSNDLTAQLSNAVVSFHALEKLLTQSTNAPVVYYDVAGHPIATNAPTITPQSTTTKLETYAKIILGIIGAILTLGSQLMVAARWLRKAVPDDMQAGGFGQVLRHVSAEINPPTQATLRANPTENEAPPAPPVTEPPKV